MPVKRRNMGVKRRREVFTKYGYRCHCCGVEQKNGFPKLQIDHWVPLFLGGSEDVENLRPLCEECHKAKTRTENKIRGKIQRLRLTKEKRKARGRKFLGRTSWGNGKAQWPKGRKLQSRPFPKERGFDRSPSQTK